MRLYATITSERASKSQGGNKYLDIVVMNERREEVLILKTKPRGDFIEVISLGGWSGVLDQIKELLLTDEEKDKIGKRQKGECKHFIVKDDYGKEYCQECGKYNVLS